MADDSKVKEAVEWYSKTRGLYETLAKKVEITVREILKSKGVNYHSITSRPKSISRYKEKASKEKYKEPLSEIFDMAGIRVTTYTDSDAKRVHEILKESFELHPEHSIDKSEELGVDRMGYRSLHCVGTLGKERLKLTENKIFKDTFLEIQIRTILQHAWAEFEHDRNYKFSGVLPKNMRRRFSIIAGTLELIDREFDDIAQAIDTYAEDVDKRTDAGDFSIPINSTSLKAYMSKKLASLIENNIVEPTFNDADDMVVEELLNIGIDSLKKLDDLFPKDYAEKVRQAYLTSKNNFLGVLRNVMMLCDVDAYFKKSWKGHWQVMTSNNVNLLKSYGIDLSEYAKRYHLNLSYDLKQK